MDNTGTYIKMCDCPEIQEQKPFDPYHHGVYYDDSWGGFTWLPRQDDLQAMVYESYRMDITDSPYLRNLTMLRDIHEFAQMNGTNHIPKEASMEQLWLAFVMKEKHGKVWDGDKWIIK